jgi:hypothetical protein
MDKKDSDVMRSAGRTIQSIEVKMGILLVTPVREPNSKDDFRLSILWQVETNTLEEGSAMFGRLLRVASDLRQWRTLRVPPHFEYFSSNCCTVDHNVREVGTPLRKSVMVHKRLFHSLSVRFLYLSPTDIALEL